MTSATTSPAPGKVTAIQALRAAAALAVALVHLLQGFAVHIDARLDWVPPAEQLAQTAVALFFVISGSVMVLSSGRLYGSRRGALHFWRRRAVRVLPPYWIATALLAAVLVMLGKQFDLGYAARSLAFIPAGKASAIPFQLFLWPGWSLFYELLFYALFGAFVALGRLRAVTLTALALIALVIAGAEVGRDDLVMFVASRPILLLFIPGMLLGLVIERGWAASAWIRWGALIAAGVVFAQAANSRAPLGWDYLWWAGCPAVLLFFAALAGPLRLPAGRELERLGDCSYAIYLLHVPFAHLWMRIYGGWLNHPGGSIGFLVTGVPLLIVLSLAFYKWIERPLTDAFNRGFGDPQSVSTKLPQTVAP